MQTLPRLRGRLVGEPRTRYNLAMTLTVTALWLYPVQSLRGQ